MTSKNFVQAGQIATPNYPSVDAQLASILATLAGLGTASTKAIERITNWTPAYTFSGGGSRGYNARNGNAWKIDQLVILMFAIDTNADSDSPSGNVSITNLPHPIRNSEGIYTFGRYAPGQVYAEDWSANHPTILVPIPGTTTAELMRHGTTGHTNVTAADMVAGAGNYINASLIYYSGT